MCGVTTIELWY